MFVDIDFVGTGKGDFHGESSPSVGLDQVEPAGVNHGAPDQLWDLAALLWRSP